MFILSNFIPKIESDRPARSTALNFKDKIKANHLFVCPKLGQ